jgi:hypothetical protein
VSASNEDIRGELPALQPENEESELTSGKVIY